MHFFRLHFLANCCHKYGMNILYMCGADYCMTTFFYMYHQQKERHNIRLFNYFVYYRKNAESLIRRLTNAVS